MGKTDKPVVLFTAEDGFNEMGDDHFVTCHSYARAISQAGGIPLTPLDIRLAQEYAAYADALVLSDGPRIHMARLLGDLPKRAHPGGLLPYPG